jgi:hypothetical protein
MRTSSRTARHNTAHILAASGARWCELDEKRKVHSRAATLTVVRSAWVRAWGNAWLRAGLFHPVISVTPWVVVCVVLAHLPGSDVGDVSWGLWVIPFSAIAGLVGSVIMVADRPLSAGARLLVVLLGILGSGTALALGLVAWFHAAAVACHGGYECPF